MAASVTLNKIRRVAATGRVYLQFGDGAELEFGSAAEVRAWAASIDASEAVVLEALRKMLVRWWVHRDPTSATPATAEGKTISLDLSQAVPLTVG